MLKRTRVFALLMIICILGTLIPFPVLVMAADTSNQVMTAAEINEHIKSFLPDTEDEARRLYIKKDAVIDYDAKIFKDVATKIKLTAKTDLEKFIAAHEYVASHIKYDFDSGGHTNTTPASEILKSGTGICQNYAIVMVALLNALDIPAAYASCTALGSTDNWRPPGPSLKYAFETTPNHAMVLAYIDGHWLESDPTMSSTMKKKYISKSPEESSTVFGRHLIFKIWCLPMSKLVPAQDTLISATTTKLEINGKSVPEFAGITHEGANYIDIDNFASILSGYSEKSYAIFYEQAFNVFVIEPSLQYVPNSSNLYDYSKVAKNSPGYICPKATRPYALGGVLVEMDMVIARDASMHVRLTDLCKYLDISCKWDAERQIIVIDTYKPY